ncbi:protease complex subunit PrcB family protein [Gelidibacter salicanalis]|uniref:Protease complex subunit PrcB family protein n=1 Tax=Gelidibacter salicanalis TaxID=291193 RepID=A0A934KV99_9FLAO|nr:protease complex subunit PrcB family protein [Gelidibacter salicanalis]MBJ7882650.1 protease complex subunit PrcB family protein [Gelidibacter salicanalis]
MKNVLIILLSILVLSCSSDDSNSEMTNVVSTLIAKDNLYGNGVEGITEQNLIISNQTTWNDLITQMNSVNNVSDNFTETDIDFSEHTIIAVFDEIKGNGGHNLELNIMSNSENIIVNVTDLAPEGNATTVITQPFHIVKIQNSDLPIIFE